MKQIFTLLPALLFFTFSWCQTPITSGDGYSDWLFVNGDKAIQVRYKEVKQENEVGYYEVQFRLNSEDPVFCAHAMCEGYLMMFGYPALDDQSTIETSYKIFNSFTGVYTVPENIPIKLSYPDGSKRILRQEGFFYTTASNSTELPANFFSNCVDNMLSTAPNEHRCKPYYSNFKDAEAIVLR